MNRGMLKFSHRKDAGVVWLCILAAFLGCIGCQSEVDETAEISNSEPVSVDKQIETAVMAESVIASLRPALTLIGDSIQGKNLSAIDGICLDSVEYTGPSSIDWQAKLRESDSSVTGATHFEWPMSEPVTVSDVGKTIWQPLQDVEFYDCSLGTESGEFLDFGTFRHGVILEGKFKSNGRNYGLKAKQEIEWVRKLSGWKIARWHQKKFHVIAKTRNYFQDVTQDLIGDEATYEKALDAAHEKLMLEKIKDGTVLQPFDPDHPFIFDVESSFQFPGVNIVDFDLDGDEDLFLYECWGRSMLLRNNGNGQYEDASEESGLVIEHAANCAVFADFDNDGDPDAFIGRSTEGSLYFVNEGGKFTRNLEFEKNNPYLKFASTATPVDINRDGLLDLYVTTYSSFGRNPKEFIAQYLAPSDHPKALEVAKNHPFLDRSGPPNVLLMNQRGKLRPVESLGDSLKQWRNSFEDVWHDFDDDGDFDLYLCNDFAPDAFLRNDTVRSSFDPVFTDVTSEIAPGLDMGFGMGASLGDYDNDGDLDIYVSNMYSKAGNRILHHFDNVNPSILASAKGNCLYQRNGKTFSQVAGISGDDVQRVAKVGWSFGGQFADFNNDGKLDLYVPSGFFTSPKSVQSDADL